MANENTIEVQIVLDDGSIQKGFAKIQDQASSTGKSIETNIGTAFVGALALATTAAFALKKALDFAIAGESISVLNEQFRILAEREGIASKALIDGLERSAKGLIDTEELLQTANGAIATLGQNAEKLPQLLDLSTKAAALFGGTSKQVFDSLVVAVETGNQKALKNAGIILDTEKVYKDFAATLGVTAGELNQVQKQTALLDATLAKGAQTFQGITNEISPVANSFQRLKVAIGEVGDSIATTFSNAFGDKIASFNNSLAEMLNPAEKTAENRLTQTTSRVKELESSLTSLQKKLSEKENSGFFESLFSGGGSITNIKNQINSVNSELNKQKDLLTALRYETQQNADEQEMSAAKQVKSVQGVTKAQLDNINLRQTQVQQAILQNEQTELAARERALQFETDYELRRAEQKAIAEERLRLFDEETKLRILEVNRNFSNELGFTEQQRENVRLSILETSAANRAQIEQQSNEDFLRRVNNTKERLAIIQQGIVNIVTRGVNLFAQALLKGGNAFEDFARGILGVVADQIIRLGEALIIQGLAIESFIIAVNSLLPGSGVAAAAAGVGLVLFGSALKSAIGAGGGGGSTSVGGGGVAGGDISSPIGGGISENPEPQKPQTKIEVNIQGSIFDSDQTGSRIVDLINNAFDQNGVQVINGATA